MTATVSSQQFALSIERPALYVIATPIGNLADISYRAVDMLRALDLLLVEDSRVASRLLQHYSIKQRLMSVHEHNEQQIAGAVLQEMTADGIAVGLISDAGTPLIADPGYRLVRRARESGIPVYTIPGPSAMVAALSIAGLASDRFVFEGFLPPKSAARRRALELLLHERRTLVFYEAPHRILETMVDLLDVCGGDREVSVARELTKLHETLYFGSLREVNAAMVADTNAARGELVIVLAGASEGDTTAVEQQAVAIVEAFSRYVPVAQAIKLATELTTIKRNRLYRLIHQDSDLGSDLDSKP